MQLKEVFYYALFTVSVAAVTYTRADDPTSELSSSDTQTAKRISKREAAVFVIDNIPVQPATNSKPTRLYRRISRQRFPSNPSYGPSRGRHGPTKAKISNSRKQYKAKRSKSTPSSSFAKKHTSRYLSDSFWKNKSKRSSWMKKRRPSKKPVKPLPSKFGKPPQLKPSVLYPPLDQEPMGFAEPPADNRPKKYLKVPVDSYGAPLRENIDDPIIKENTEIFENYDVHETNTGPDYVNEQLQKDSNIEFTNNYESLANPYVDGKDPVAEEFSINGYLSGPSKHYEIPKKRRPNYTDIHKLMNRPWLKHVDEEDKVLVGGQYAEPPGRYVPIYASDVHVFDDRERYSVGDMDAESSATVSPYINYKNSNLAFSPQNLNDAFSIDK
ncbi:hypothetical protein NE865_03132 [Phthorimaea operculella]|nr:hypothetical protein NE865_03132 [Phthorimaea operculella]